MGAGRCGLKAAIAAVWVLLMLNAAWAADERWRGLVAAEQAFVADAHARGMRAACLDILAEEAVLFRPGPVPGRAWWQAQADDDGGQSERAPAAVEVGAGDDFGYTYGPWRRSVAKGGHADEFGHYLTVWKRQRDGRWKVLVDHGVIHAGLSLPTAVLPRAPTMQVVGPSSATVGSLLARDAEANAAAVAGGTALVALGTADLVLLRAGAAPAAPTATTAGLALGSGDPAQRRLVIAERGDLAATWGEARNGATWLRIWRWDESLREWRLAVDLGEPAHGTGS